MIRVNLLHPILSLAEPKSLSVPGRPRRLGRAVWGFLALGAAGAVVAVVLLGERWMAPESGTNLAPAHTPVAVDAPSGRSAPSPEPVEKALSVRLVGAFGWRLPGGVRLHELRLNSDGAYRIEAESLLGTAPARLRSWLAAEAGLRREPGIVRVAIIDREPPYPFTLSGVIDPPAVGAGPPSDLAREHRVLAAMGELAGSLELDVKALGWRGAPQDGARVLAVEVAGPWTQARSFLKGVVGLPGVGAILRCELRRAARGPDRTFLWIEATLRAL